MSTELDGETALARVLQEGPPLAELAVVEFAKAKAAHALRAAAAAAVAAAAEDPAVEQWAEACGSERYVVQQRIAMIDTMKEGVLAAVEVRITPYTQRQKERG